MIKRGCVGEKIILLAISIGLLHTTRNLTDIYYLAYFFSVILIMLMSANRKRALLTVVFLLSIIYVSALSYATTENGDLWLGIVRYCFVAPFAIYFLTTELKENIRVNINKLFLTFIAISAFSLFYQFIYVEIAWFAETSWRSGVVKYSTLAGNENAYGAIAGIGLFLALRILKNTFYKLTYFSVILIAGFASLQKMAIVTMMLAVCLQIWIYGGSGHNERRILKIYLTFGACIFLLVYFLAESLENPYIKYAIGIFSSDTDEVGDVNLFISMLDRAYMLPMAVIDYWGGLEIMVGVGLYGAGGVLGYQNYPMAHNFVVEMIGIFGFFIGIILLSFFFYIAFVSTKILLINKNNNISELKTYAGIYILIIIGGVFTGGFVFHPVTGIILWFVAAQLIRFARQNCPAVESIK